jgi:hypothetical protein
MNIKKSDSSFKNKFKYVLKEFILNCIALFSVILIAVSIFLIFVSPNFNYFWLTISKSFSGIIGISLINAILIFPIDIFIKNKKINLSLSFIPTLIISVILYFGVTEYDHSENMNKLSFGTVLICLIVNYLRFKRVSKKNIIADHYPPLPHESFRV